MPRILPHQALVAKNILLDGRLALFHRTQRWLAAADLHFGYEISQRAAGRLVPLWGMASIAERLDGLLEDYRPNQLVILGDLVHDRAAGVVAREFLERIRARCETIVIAGNHDRRLGGTIEFRDSWQTAGFHFHHGHCAAETPGRIQVIGHHHPAETITDGAGLRLKCPAFIQQTSCWIMPAFSPWASGTAWRPNESCRAWLCTPQRILRMPETDAVAS